jgi:hypothetical protein
MAEGAGSVSMSKSDKILMTLGASPAASCALLMTAAMIAGLPLSGWPAALAVAGLLAATTFPALANLLRMRRLR